MYILGSIIIVTRCIIHLIEKQSLYILKVLEMVY
jgi:hypothetical protein